MTVPASARRAGPYNGNDATTAFGFTFKVFDEADVLVVENTDGVEADAVLNSDYTVSLNADQDASPGGTVTYLSAPASGTTVTIVGDLDYDQPTQLPDGGAYRASTNMNALDRIVMLLQQLWEQFNRAIKFPVSDNDDLVTTLPSAADRANKALIFDADGSVAISTEDYEEQQANVNSAANAAAASAAAAAASQGAAATSATNSEASRDAIDNRIYPGTYSSDPTTRPDGTARQDGDVYFTSAGAAKVYGSGVWALVPGASAADLADSSDAANGAALIGFAGESLYAAAKSLVVQDVTQWRRNRSNERTVYGRDTVPYTASKLHVPTLTTANLASSSGLANHASGGICAASAGVTGTGSITLPSAIDTSKPFRVHLLIEVNENTNNLTLQLGSTGTPPWWSGLNFSSIKASAITATTGNAFPFNQVGATANIPASTQFWVNICGDGQYITSSLIPNIASGSLDATWLQRSVSVFQPKYNCINWAEQIITDQSSGAGQYTWGRVGQSDQLTQVYVTASSTSTRLIGVYANVGEMDGPGDRRMGAPLAMHWNQSQDCVGSSTAAPFLLLPPHWGSPGSRDFVMQHHPNGNPGQFLQSNSGPAALALYYGGYGQGTVTGCQNSSDFAGATSSNWGAPTGLQYRKNFLDYFRNAFRFDGKLIHFGMSMGLMNSLRYFQEYGEGDAIVGISGACDLTDSYNSRGFSTVINAGYGAWYESLVDANTGNTPESSPTQWRRINRGVGATGLKALTSPHNWRNLYAGGTAYAKNDVVYRPYTGGIAALSAYDPVLNPKAFAGLPIKLWHGSSDATIPAAQATSFVTAVSKYASGASVVSVAGGGHLDSTMFASTIPADIVSYLDSL